MAISQDSIELTVHITALDPEEELVPEEVMEDVANAITDTFADDGYAVTVGHRDKDGTDGG